jgi:biopolymer transport protein ExbD
MSDSRKASGWSSYGLRTKFVPKSRLRNGLTSISPWLDIVLLLVFFAFAESRIMLRPGVVVELPSAKFEGGVPGGMIMVVSALETAQGRSEMVFFDDEPYDAASSNRMVKLGKALRRYGAEHDDTALTIYADKSITHVTISRIIHMARDAGLDRVNLGTGK